MDDSIERAIRIGQQNARVIELAKNWCSHLQVEHFGGTGLVEIETGLPIGSRFFKCVHASARGMAGMDLRHIALDFYDRNCRGCTNRNPVRLPNLTELLNERDQALQERAQSQAAEQAKRESAFAQRQSARDQIKKHCDEPTAGLIDAITSLDRDSSKEDAETLPKLAKLVPERFRSEIVEALLDLGAESESPIALESILSTLLILNVDSNRLCTLALQILAKMMLPTAGTIVANSLSSDLKPLLPAAMPSIIRLAAQDERSIFGGSDRPAEPGALLASYKLDALACMSPIADFLTKKDKEHRILGASAIRALRQIAAECGLDLVTELVRSLALPDDHYGRGPAKSHVQDLLAEMLESSFLKVDEPLTNAFRSLSADDNEIGLHHVYLRLFREFRHGGVRARKNSETHAIIFARLLESLSTKCAAQGSTELLEFLRHDAEHYPDLVEIHIDGLLGALAIITDERTSATQSFLALDLPPDFLAALEASSRKDHLRWLAEATAKLIGRVAAQRPTTVGSALLSMLDTVDDSHEPLRAGLVTAMGRMTANREVLPKTLPHLYRSMTGASSLVRAAGVRAYGKAIERNSDDLPPLLHDTFLVLLSDSYLIVHYDALHVLDRHRIPEEYRDRLPIPVLNIIRAHDGPDGDRNILKLAIDVFLSLHRSTEKNFTDSFTDWLIERIRRCRNYDAAELLIRNAGVLDSRLAFTKTVLELLSQADVSDHKVEDLTNVLSEVPPDNLRSLGDELANTLRACLQNGHRNIDRSVEILTTAGLWQQAVSLAKFDESHLSDSKWDRPLKLLAKERVASCLIEFDASEGDRNNLQDNIKTFRQARKERQLDEDENAEKRDPLFGFGN